MQVLSEVKSPRKIFPIWTLVAMGIAAFLFIMVNVAYVGYSILFETQGG
jgi:amino acid transporter